MAPRNSSGNRTADEARLIIDKPAKAVIARGSALLKVNRSGVVGRGQSDMDDASFGAVSYFVLGHASEMFANNDGKIDKHLG